VRIVAHAALIAAAFCLGYAAEAQTAMPDLSGRDPHWIEDEDSACWAANPDPEPGESIMWTGPCENGLISGQGILNWYLNGRLVGRDEGNFKAGELFGHGRISSLGASYEGEFPGRGVLTLPDGSQIEAMSVKEAAGWSIAQAPPSDAR